MTDKTPTEEAWESLAALVETPGAHWRLTDSPDDDCVDVPVADLRLALADRARLLSEHEKSKEAVEALKPFAETGRVLDAKPQDAAVWAGQRPAAPLTFGDFRRAAKVYAALTTQEETKP